LPTHERIKTEPIPANVKGGFGESNVRYVYTKNGVRTNSPWMSRAVAFVEQYAKDNLLNDPEAENVSEDVVTIAEEQAAGFQSNPAIRREVEQYAMRQARKELERRGYANFTNTALYKCYDYTCMKMGTLFYVEVKGTQTQGLSVQLRFSGSSQQIFLPKSSRSLWEQYPLASGCPNYKGRNRRNIMHIIYVKWNSFGLRFARRRFGH
jgi:hypothetical protein